MRSKPISKEIKIKKHTYKLEIYPSLVSWEIFPHGYEASLYAFSNKEKLNKLIEKKYIFEPKGNNENTI